MISCMHDRRIRLKRNRYEMKGMKNGKDTDASVGQP